MQCMVFKDSLSFLDHKMLYYIIKDYYNDAIIEMYMVKLNCSHPWQCILRLVYSYHHHVSILGLLVKYIVNQTLKIAILVTYKTVYSHDVIMLDTIVTTYMY